VVAGHFILLKMAAGVALALLFLPIHTAVFQAGPTAGLVYRRDWRDGNARRSSKAATISSAGSCCEGLSYVLPNLEL